MSRKDKKKDKTKINVFDPKDKDRLDKAMKGKGFLDLDLGGGKEDRIEDLVPIVKFGREYQAIRLVGPVVAYVYHWIPVFKKDKSIVRIPRVALEDESKDPYRNIPGVETRKHWYSNCLVREDDNAIKVAKFPISVARELRSIVSMNVHKDEKGKKATYELAHEENGADVHIRFDQNAPGSAKYSVQKGDHTPLTKRERKRLRSLHDLEDLVVPKPLEEAKKDAEEIAKIAAEGDKAHSSDIQFGDPGKKNKKKRKKSE